jgi:hypothetical protein
MLSKEQFKVIYSRYQSSGLSVRDFCRNEALTEAKFYYWQKKMVKMPPRGFVPLLIEKGNQLPAFSSFPNGDFISGCMIEISYPNGTLLKLSGRMDYELLRSLILINR